jgi:type III restriction enzyme
MKVALKPYQRETVEKLVWLSETLLSIWGEQEIVFKAPTGSGKTVMMTAFLERFREEELWDFAFVWVSVNNLHTQSKKSLERNLSEWHFRLYDLSDVRDKLAKNDILFFNWQSVTKKARTANKDKDVDAWDYTNIFMRENESDRNLPTFITGTLEEWRRIILIIDESQLYLSDETERLIASVIQPALRIEVSATPKKNAQIKVELSDPIGAGMIKKDIVINEKFGELNLLDETGDAIIIDQWIQKQIELRSAYQREWVSINPLILIQLPWETAKVSSLEEREIEKVEKILQAKYGITRENKKLAVWLSEDKTKDVLDGIEAFDSSVDVLIFKQAIATGWDCPRASILLMFREIRSITFEIQTVGRIMRMPELRHYSEESLNRGYVYTNFWEINIEKWEAKDYIQSRSATRKAKSKNIILPNSVYRKRLDYNDLSPKEIYRQTFYTTLLEDIWWSREDMTSVLRDNLIERGVRFDKQFKVEILLEKTIIGADEWDGMIKKWHTKVNEDILQWCFDRYMKKLVSGYNKSRSWETLVDALYAAFHNFFSLSDASEIQRIVLTNTNIFEYIIKKSFEAFESKRVATIEAKEDRKVYDFSIPDHESYSEQYRVCRYPKCIMSPCYFRDESKNETRFVEEYLEKNPEIEYWYKNGVSKAIYFWVEYNYEWRKRVFYPDFIVAFKNWKVGIFDPKDGNTASSLETRLKAEALQRYIAENRETPLIWGIVIKQWEWFLLNASLEYSFSESLSGWERL